MRERENQLSPLACAAIGRLASTPLPWPSGLVVRASDWYSDSEGLGFKSQWSQNFSVYSFTLSKAIVKFHWHCNIMKVFRLQSPQQQNTCKCVPTAEYLAHLTV